MVFSDCNLMQTIKEMVDDDTNAENQDYKSESSDDDPDHDFDEHVSSVNELRVPCDSHFGTDLHPCVWEG